MPRDHVLVFGNGYDIPARMRGTGSASGREVTTSVMCWPEHLAKIDDALEHSRVIAMRPGACDEEWIAFARTIHSVDPVTRIGSFYDECRPQAAAVAQALGLSTYSAQLIELVTDKYAMRRRLAETGVESTVSAVVGDPGGLRGFAAEHGYPCVVKPLAGEASKGVSILRALALQPGERGGETTARSGKRF